jgi:hypothetical protein
VENESDAKKLFGITLLVYLPIDLGLLTLLASGVKGEEDNAENCPIWLETW